MPVITIRIDDELLNKIENLAKKTGKKRSQIIKEILKKQLSNYETVEEYVNLMKKGKKTGNLNLDEVEKWLENTEPYFETWEEAINYSRQRSK